MSGPASDNSFAEIAGIALIHVNAEGIICGWNAGAEALFGHAASAAISQRVDIIVPDQYRAMHWAGFNRVVKTHWLGANGWDGPIEGLHADGSTSQLEVMLVGLPSGKGDLSGVLALFRRPVTTT